MDWLGCFVADTRDLGMERKITGLGIAMKSNKRILLFDLGGVLADLGDPSTSMKLKASPEQFWNIWLNSEYVRAFESGLCSISEFAPMIAGELGELNLEDFEPRLRDWRLKLLPDTENFLRSVAKNYQLALLSNTNELHWSQIQSSRQVFSMFAKLFLSFETRKYKPQKSAFEQVLRHFGGDPEDVTFLDDSTDNIWVAKDVGFHAVQVAGIKAVEQAILNWRTRA